MNLKVQPSNTKKAASPKSLLQLRSTNLDHNNKEKHIQNTINKNGKNNKNDMEFFQSLK